MKTASKNKLVRLIFFILLASLGAVCAVYLFETRVESSQVKTLSDAFWLIWATISTVGFGDITPRTPGGRGVIICVMIFGIGAFTILYSEVASIFVDRRLKEGRGMKPLNVKRHIIICGWNKKVEKIIRQLHAKVIKSKKPVVVITRAVEQIVVDEKDPAFAEVYFINGDPADDNVLQKANIKEAESAIIVPDPEQKEQVDAQSLMTVLAIESLNPRVYTCVEVRDSKNIEHFKHARIDEIISVEETAELMLAQAVLNHGITRYYTELLTFQEKGNEVYKVPVPEKYIGKSFKELLNRLIDEQFILTGVESRGELKINPPKDYTFQKDDSILVIGYTKPNIK